MKRGRTQRRRASPPLVGALLRLAWQQVRLELAADVAAAGFDELQDAHLSVFQHPGPDGLRPVDLARQIRMSRQATNYLIAQLEGFGYVQRRGENGERRRVYLTARGRKVQDTIRASVKRSEARTARQVGREPFDGFMNVLRTMAGGQWVDR